MLNFIVFIFVIVNGNPGRLVWVIPKFISLALIVTIAAYFFMPQQLPAAIYWLLLLAFIIIFNRSRIWLGVCSAHIYFSLTPTRMIRNEIDYCYIRNRCVAQSSIPMKKVNAKKKNKNM